MDEKLEGRGRSGTEFCEQGRMWDIIQSGEDDITSRDERLQVKMDLDFLSSSAL